MDAIHMYKMCIKKKVYRTREFALERAKALTEQFGKPYYVYKCPLCLNYHLTSHKHEGAKYEGQ